MIQDFLFHFLCIIKKISGISCAYISKTTITQRNVLRNRKTRYNEAIKNKCKGHCLLNPIKQTHFGYLTCNSTVLAAITPRTLWWRVALKFSRREFHFPTATVFPTGQVPKLNQSERYCVTTKGKVKSSIHSQILAQIISR